jgi:hypothetical protein
MAENFVDTSPVSLLAFWAAVGNLAFLALEDPLLQRNSVQTHPMHVKSSLRSKKPR